MIVPDQQLTEPAFASVEVARPWRAHRTTLYRLLREGKLPGFRVGSDWRFSVDAIEQWQRDYMKTIPKVEALILLAQLRVP